MHIRRLHAHIFDVFLGTGFNNWTRVKRTHYGVAIVGGNRLQRSTIRDLTETLKRY